MLGDEQEESGKPCRISAFCLLVRVVIARQKEIHSSALAMSRNLFGPVGTPPYEAYII